MSDQITFDLNLSFSKSDLAAIFAADASVVVAKPADNSGSKPNVAWLTFRPLENNNISWEEVYGIYASNTLMEDGASIAKSSAVNPAVPGKVYTLQPDGTFGAPADGGTLDSFTVVNKLENARKYMTIGLTQDARIGGELVAGNAISASNVLYQSTAVMTPYTTVFLWIQSKIKSNSVCTKVTSPMSEITFGGGVNNLSYRYDSATGLFIPA
jgi:hypothetical protein